ncbi:Uncharacterized protein APZ42_028924 [Daphnia magna]|uniref:MULE transposase domain-containing protein n=1 Tax=Daphnia magna TaxID=35525 RepID=A0A164Q378_9CRUS|nr:Uncharacterized protein APZ42_028924 [Daphnia magna]
MFAHGNSKNPNKKFTRTKDSELQKLKMEKDKYPVKVYSEKLVEALVNDVKDERQKVDVVRDLRLGDDEIYHLIALNKKLILSMTLFSLLIKSSLASETPVIPLMFLIHMKRIEYVHSFFFSRVAELIPEIASSKKIVIVTDDEKAITNAVSKTWPDIPLFRCWIHAWQNMKLQLRKFNIRDKVGVSNYKTDFISLLLQKTEKSYKSVLARFYLKKWDKNFFTYYDKNIDTDINKMGSWILLKFGIKRLTNNQSESLNATMKRLINWNRLSIDNMANSLRMIDGFFLMKIRRGKLVSHITQCSPSDVRQMSRSDVEYNFFISAGQPDIRFGCSMDVFFFGLDILRISERSKNRGRRVERVVGSCGDIYVVTLFKAGVWNMTCTCVASALLSQILAAMYSIDWEMATKKKENITVTQRKSTTRERYRRSGLKKPSRLEKKLGNPVFKVSNQQKRTDPVIHTPEEYDSSEIEENLLPNKRKLREDTIFAGMRSRSPSASVNGSTGKMPLSPSPLLKESTGKNPHPPSPSVTASDGKRYRSPPPSLTASDGKRSRSPSPSLTASDGKRFHSPSPLLNTNMDDEPENASNVELEVAIAESLFMQPVIVNQRNAEIFEREEILEIGKPESWLPIKVINAAMELIRQKLAEAGGLHYCQWGAMLQYNPANSHKWIQILHNNRDHWIVACKGFDLAGSNLVLLYESNCSGHQPDQHFIYCIAQIERTKNKILKIGLMDCESQKERGSCGLYAIAFATALAFSFNQSELRFDGSQMPSNLMKCISDGAIIPSPTKGLRTRSNWRPKKKISIPLFCVCRMPDFGVHELLPKKFHVMVQCNISKEYFHQECENIPESAIKCKKVPCCLLCVILGLMDCESQKERGSCGLYAIAFATALAFSFNQSELSATFAKNISIRNARTYPNLPSSAKKCPGIAHLAFKR